MLVSRSGGPRRRGKRAHPNTALNKTRTGWWHLSEVELLLKKSRLCSYNTIQPIWFVKFQFVDILIRFICKIPVMFSWVYFCLGFWGFYYLIKPNFELATYLASLYKVQEGSFQISQLFLEICVKNSKYFLNIRYKLWKLESILFF